jgi:hypothetical protein
VTDFRIQPSSLSLGYYAGLFLEIDQAVVLTLQFVQKYGLTPLTLTISDGPEQG